jgi:hypothetical protein
MKYLVYAAITWLALFIVFACCGCATTKPYAMAIDTGRQPVYVVGIEHHFK